MTLEDTTTTTLSLSVDEARWLATAVSVLRRVLQGFPVETEYSREGLGVLSRVAEHLPTGHYLPRTSPGSHASSAT